MKDTLLWIKEAMKYDWCVVFKFWWNGKDFLQERNRWIEENKRFQKIDKIL